MHVSRQRQRWCVPVGWSDSLGLRMPGWSGATWKFDTNVGDSVSNSAQNENAEHGAADDSSRE